jgi:hypothetical protein
MIMLTTGVATATAAVVVTAADTEKGERTRKRRARWC